MNDNNTQNVDLNFHNEDDKSKTLTMTYKALYQLNDVILGIIFLIGSFLFFNDSTTFIGTILFVIGSVQMTIRPLIAFIHDMHLAHIYREKKGN